MIVGWLRSSIKRKLTAALVAALVLASAGFLIVLVLLYQGALTRERADATGQVNRLLQVALENAMLKRDLDGLKDIVERLGAQPGIRAVMIANPAGEIRFADAGSRVGAQLTPADLGCPTCQLLADIADAGSLVVKAGGEMRLRSVNPIRNREACVGCHGAPARSPLNGVLVVDMDGRGIERDAIRGAALLSGAGSLVVLASVAATAWLVRRHVVRPLADLSTASLQLAEGRQEVRARVESPDEIGQLARSFNMMADRIGASMGALEDQRAFLQSILDTLPDGLRIIGEDYQVVLDNQAYREQTGLNESQVGRPCYLAHGQPGPCPPTLFNCPLVELVGTPEPVKYVHRHRRPDGSELVAELMVAAVAVPRGGRPHRLIIESFRDLSKQIRYSQEQRLAEIGQLATGVAHEIRNPLASVRLGLQAMLRKLNAGNSQADDLKSYLKLVDGEVEKCIEVTGRLLRLGMPPSERLQLLFLDRIAREVLSLLGWEAESRSVALVFDLPEDSLRVLATDSELRMLILNLAQNAFHAMPDGGTLAVRGRVEGRRVLLELEDTGVGIEPAVVSRIFDPFFSRRADGEQGTGLGLTICKAIVTRYHGSIEVRSTPGKGTVFTVSLPLASTDATA